MDIDFEEKETPPILGNNYKMIALNAGVINRARERHAISLTLYDDGWFLYDDNNHNLIHIPEDVNLGNWATILSQFCIPIMIVAVIYRRDFSHAALTAQRIWRGYKGRQIATRRLDDFM